MTYQSFYSAWHHLACFSTAQVRAIYPDFHRGNYLQWQKAGYIVPLRQGWYAFADYINKPDIARYIASKIYTPSYISLHTALSYHGDYKPIKSTIRIILSKYLKEHLADNLRKVFFYRTGLCV